MPLGGKGPATVACLWTEAGIALICIVLRWYARKYMKGSVGYDDFVLWVTWVFMAAFAALFTISSIYGFGQHIEVLSADDIMMAVKIELCGQFTVALAMGLSKTAVALFLLRIITEKWHKAALWFWIVTMNILSVLLAITCFAQCYPLEGLWDPTIKIIACPISLTMVAYVMCAWSAAMDFFLALFPWYFLWNVNIRQKEKISICVSLSLGIFAGVCGIVRTTGLGVLSQSTDYLYATADSVMWTSSELCVTIICVSIPAMRPYWSRMMGNSSAGGGYQQNTGDQTGPYTKTKGSRSQPDEEFAMATVTAGAKEQQWDNSSDKSILAHKDQANGIHKTQEFTVTYDSS